MPDLTSTDGQATPIYLGWDGSYVLSMHPLEVCMDGEFPFLSPVKGHCIDVSDGELVFGHLKLKKFRVVQIALYVKPTHVVRRSGPDKGKTIRLR